MQLPSHLFALSLLALAACPNASMRQTAGGTLLGDWGGAHAALTLTPGGGTIRYDCAHGTLSTSVVTDDAGHFDVRGVHVREHGGPVRLGESPDSAPARYLGQLDGLRMLLRVAVGPDTLGPFQLQRDSSPQLMRCL